MPAQCSGPLPVASAATSLADFPWLPAPPIDPAFRFADSTSPAVPTNPHVGNRPRVLTAARTTIAFPLHSTVCACAAFPYSRKGVAVRFSPGCESLPACAGAAPAAARRFLLSLCPATQSVASWDENHTL